MWVLAVSAEGSAQPALQVTAPYGTVAQKEAVTISYWQQDEVRCSEHSLLPPAWHCCWQS